MNIIVKGAKENNLKNIDVSMPQGKIIGVTGVSGSGKSTFTKEVIARYGYKNYCNFSAKSLREELIIDEVIDVESIEGLPPTLLIDVVNSVNNTRSTLSTVTGLQNIIRKLFSEYGEYKCKQCGHTIENDIWKIIDVATIHPYVELKCDIKFQQRRDELQKMDKILKEIYFDENNQQTSLKSKKKYAYIYLKSDKNINRKQCELIYKKIGVTVKADLPNVGNVDLLDETFCEFCKLKVKQIDKTRFSFNVRYEDGGGACRLCQGYGTETTLKVENLVLDVNKPISNGAIEFISDKGIKYTKVSDKFIEAVGKKYGFKIDTPLIELNEEQKKILFYGSSEIIKFTDRTGGNGGKKQEEFLGVVNYLMECYKQGKGKEELEKIIDKQQCSKCKGTRIDEDFSHIYINSISIYEFLQMNIEEIVKELTYWRSIYSDTSAKYYIKELSSRLEIFNKLDCGYLTLERASITLSGGELQRLRLATFITNNLEAMCIILDEPSTGLHPLDIQNLITIFYEMKEQNHTVIVVEHNKYILDNCDYIVDLGPEGGDNGGFLLFADTIDNLDKYDTYTTKFLNRNKELIQRKAKSITDIIPIEWEPHIHLKAGKCNIPTNALIAICGVSGSGKSTFVKEILIPYLQTYGDKYNVKKIEYMGQKNSIKTESSTVATMLEINQLVAKLFVTENPKFSVSEFLLNSEKGKCPICLGKGSIEGEIGLETCECCQGKKFSKEVLEAKYEGYTIDEILNKSLEQLYEILNFKKLKQVLALCIKAGIGYLSLARTSKTLSKGEIQRIKLVSIVKKGTSGSVIILDEPTRGLHYKDITSLLNIFDEIIEKGNTLVVIDHSIDFINASDWIIEFGPGAGRHGGQIVFAGDSRQAKQANTKTTNLLNGFQIKKIESIQSSVQEKKVLEHRYNLKAHEINYIEEDINKIKDIVLYINKLYLKSIMPIKIVSLQENEDIDIAKSNLMIELDINKPQLPEKYTLLECLDLQGDTALMYAEKLENDKKIGKQIFYYRNHLGKCKACSGTGRTLDIEKNLLFNQNGNLNDEILIMLKKQTNYTKVQPELKRAYKVDISKSINEMTNDEKILLLYGDKTKILRVDKKYYYWEGLYKILKKYGRNYLSNEINERIKEGWSTNSCQFCKGKLLNNKYTEIKVNELGYGEFLSRPIENIQKENMGVKFKETFNWLQKLGLSHFTLNDIVNDKSKEEIALIKLISIYVNNIYGMGIVLFNYDKLIKENEENVMKLLRSLSNKNTIVIV